MESDYREQSVVIRNHHTPVCRHLRDAFVLPLVGR